MEVTQQQDVRIRYSLYIGALPLGVRTWWILIAYHYHNTYRTASMPSGPWTAAMAANAAFQARTFQ